MKNSFIGIVLSLRWPNLLITALTLCIVYFFLLIPINAKEGLELNLKLFDFLLLMTSTLFIMAGGYIINDLMDAESDVINQKPGAIYKIPRRMVLSWYGGLSLIGIALSLYLCFRIDLLQLWTIQLLAFLLLLLYSTNLKSTPLAGNLIIAALCGIVPLLPLIFDKLSYVFQYQPGFIVINFLSLFAFLITLIREMIKDIEDVSGDKAVNLATFPIIFGVEAARWTAFIFLMMFKILILSLLYLVFGEDWIMTLYLLVMIFAPMIVISYRVAWADNKVSWHQLSTWLKWIMLSGMGYAVIYYLSYL